MRLCVSKDLSGKLFLSLTTVLINSIKVTAYLFDFCWLSQLLSFSIRAFYLRCYAVSFYIDVNLN